MAKDKDVAAAASDISEPKKAAADPAEVKLLATGRWRKDDAGFYVNLQPFSARDGGDMTQFNTDIRRPLEEAARIESLRPV